MDLVYNWILIGLKERKGLKWIIPKNEWFNGLNAKMIKFPKSIRLFNNQLGSSNST